MQAAETSQVRTEFWIACGLALTAVLCWAGNYVLGRAIRADVPPVGLAFWRWVLASLILLPVALRAPASAWQAVKENRLAVFALALFGAAMFQSFSYLGLARTEALNALLLLTLNPIFVMILAYVWLGDAVTWRQIFGIVISFCGAVYLICRGSLEVLTSLSLNAGDLWILAAVVTWGFYSISLKYKPTAVPPMMLVFLTAIGGVVILIPFYVFETLVITPVQLSWPTIWAVGYTGIFASIVAFACFNGAVARIGPSKTVTFLHLMPVVGSILAVMFLGERFAIYHWIGFPVVFVGVLIATTTWRLGLRAKLNS
ncbi:MAG: DMT family transporter [Pseudomonadota bacterium]